jgi:hypothetical protein
MTEAEWLACNDPEQALDFLGNNASDRELRLFACACCRTIWDLLTDERSRAAVEIAERMADGTATENQRKVVWARIGAAMSVADVAASRAADFHIDALEVADLVLQSEAKTDDHALTLKATQSTLIRCIFGNPFCPVVIATTWQTRNVVALAQAIYDERAFDRMPFLADALEDVGCTNAEILAHCRGPGPHVKGCWVLDLLLGKGTK